MSDAEPPGAAARDPYLPAIYDSPEDGLAFDTALGALTREHPRAGRVVELRIFGGLDFDEIGAVLGVSPEAAHRDSRFAMTWMCRELSRRAADAGGVR